MALMVPSALPAPTRWCHGFVYVISQGNGLQQAVFPICFNALVLVILGVAYNTLTGRQYPHSQRWRETAGQRPSGHFVASDVDAALAHYNQLLDVSREDLEGCCIWPGGRPFSTLGDLRCSDIMSRPPLAVEAGVSLKDAWALMRSRQVKALPVVDAHRLVLGIVTVADFMRLANLDVHEGLGQRLRTLVMGCSGQPGIGWRDHVAPRSGGGRTAARHGSCAPVFAGRAPSGRRSLTHSNNSWASLPRRIWCARWRVPCTFRKRGRGPAAAFGAPA